MKDKKIVFLMLLFVTNISFAQQFPCNNLPDSIYRTDVPTEAYHNSELQIYNQTKYWRSTQGTDLRVRIIPVGALMNGDFEYSPKAANNLLVGQPKKITGYDTILPVQFQSDSKSYTPGNFDKEPGGNCNFAFGFGKYKIEFYLRNDTIPPYPGWELVNYVYIDFRDAAQGRLLPPEYNDTYDVRIDFFTRDTITFQHEPKYSNDSNHRFKFWHINLVNKNIRMWNLFGTCLPALTPDKGLFIPDTSDNGTYLSYPLNANLYNDSLGHENPGEISMNLKISHNTSTKSTLIDTSTKIIVTDKAALLIDSGKVFNMTTPSSPSNGTNNLIIDTLSKLSLSRNATLIVNDHNTLTLKKHSGVKFFSGSQIVFMPGGILCNEGADFLGGSGGYIIFKGSPHSACATIVNDYAFRDSIKLILDTNATLEIPDSSTINLKGITTTLIMNQGSKLLMGKNSKIILDSNAKIIAHNATFGPIDTTKTWDGIYCSNTGGDTIIGCKFVNAKNGINYTNKLSAHRAIIKDCKFINKSNEGISGGIYAYNSSRILICGNEFYSETSFKFDNAVYLEYCTSDELNVIDNIIEDAINGIVDIGSWSYIARNTITGEEGSGYGIVLDNYSGRIKYNVIENFSHSLYTLVSDPYLYRNSFVNASDVNLELESYSLPLLRPVQSGELKYWLGGDNVISISNHGVGINLVEESYPLMKDGYNKFYLNGSDYFITGDIPSEFEDSLEARNNFWDSDESPSKYNLSEATVKYSPTEDGSPGNRTFNTIIPMSIGFERYDTLNILDESDNPIITNLFMLANNELITNNYTDAIDHFKEIVSAGDTIFTNLSLKKIYYCYEKTNFFSSGCTEAGKSSTSDQGFLVATRGAAEIISETFLSWDKPLQASANFYFSLPKGRGIFGFGRNILDDISFKTRVFFQSGKRYTRQILLGELENGRQEFTSDINNINGEVGENWFWIDLDIDKYINVKSFEIVLNLSIDNIFNAKNSTIINPVTGKAYEFGDPTPDSYNDPIYPDLQAPITPYPFNPARYLTPRNIKFGISLKL